MENARKVTPIPTPIYCRQSIFFLFFFVAIVTRMYAENVLVSLTPFYLTNKTRAHIALLAFVYFCVLFSPGISQQAARIHRKMRRWKMNHWEYILVRSSSSSRVLKNHFWEIFFTLGEMVRRSIESDKRQRRNEIFDSTWKSNRSIAANMFPFVLFHKFWNTRLSHFI